MAFVTRYFSTAAAGAGDGTTWADRAILFTGGAWSTVLTGIDFTGTDSLLCYIGPGDYSVSVTLVNSLFATTKYPTNKNQLYWHGCDSSGNPLTPPDPNWKSCEPDWDWSGFPKITRTGTSYVSGVTWMNMRLVAVFGSYNSYIFSCNGIIDWCYGENTAAGTGATVFSAGLRITNSIGKIVSGSTGYSGVFTYSAECVNCRAVGITGVGGGTCNGFRSTSYSTPRIIRCTTYNNTGPGLGSSSTQVAFNANIQQCVFADNGGAGIEMISTGSQTQSSQVDKCMITGNGGYGIDPQAETQVVVTNSRLRDNTSGNINSITNIPETFGNYTTDSDDASEYVDGDNATLSLRDYTIKAGATIHGMGFGVAEQSVGGGSVFPVLGPSIIHPGKLVS